MIRSIIAGILAIGAPLAALAEEQNVQSLLSAGFNLVGIVPSPAGPGLFLQKGDKLFACFVVETPTSPELKTRYCKPVR
ncbi:MAG TPA: hypothetical protein VKT73_07880 [Xanthobacteraceae bacterium]|nr:hypothetical protein [Xanthobacteraceae bacterium]